MRKANLARVSTAVLQREIERRRKELPKLIAERDALNARIAELEGLDAPAPPAKTAKGPTKRKRRAKRTPAKRGRLSLNDALAQVLQGKKSLSVAEAAEEVLALGYKSRSKDFRRLVYQTLYHGDQFKKAGRGRFALKG